MPAYTHLVHDGEPAEHASLLLSGYAYRHKITGDGAPQIISLHVAGEFGNLQNSFLPISDHGVQRFTKA